MQQTNMTNLRYHNKSLQLIGQKPMPSDEVYSDLPESVAEWYSLVDGVELLKRYSNIDFPIIPSEFKTHTYGDKELIVFMYDNAGILWYAFQNNGNDDPPVFVNIEPPPDNWVYDSESFSTFIYTWFFDNLHYFRKNLFIRKNGKPLHKDTLGSVCKMHNYD